jgi:hypothetical protein
VSAARSTSSSGRATGVVHLSTDDAQTSSQSLQHQEDLFKSFTENITSMIQSVLKKEIADGFARIENRLHQLLTDGHRHQRGRGRASLTGLNTREKNTWNHPAAEMTAQSTAPVLLLLLLLLMMMMMMTVNVIPEKNLRSPVFTGLSSFIIARATCK